MKVLIILSLMAISFFYAHASCYVVGNLKGTSAKAYDKYKLSDDGISNQKFMLEINGDASKLTPNNDLVCTQADSNTLLCFYTDPTGSKSTTEVWAVLPKDKKVIYTKTMNGFGELNGGELFIGNILGRCD